MLSSIFYTIFSLCNLLICLVGVLLLPETVAVHITLRGVVVGMGSPAVYLAFPAAAALMSGAVWLCEARLHRRRTLAKACCFGVGAVLIYIGWLLFSLVSDGVGAGETVRFPSAVAIGLPFCMFYLANGVHFFRLQPNGFLGIRTTATKQSRLVWDKTHRLGGVLFLAAGLISMAVCLVASNVLAESVELYLLLVPLALMVAAPFLSMLYARILYRHMCMKEKTDG